MKKLLLLFIILISHNFYSQIYKVEYQRITYKEYENGKNLINPTTLYVSSNKSMFFEDAVIKGKTTNVTVENFQKGNVLGKLTSGDSIGKVIIKDRKRKIYQQRKNSAIFSKNAYRIVIDSVLPKFNWSIKDETKEIMGIKVQKAVTQYKKRKITAWFSQSININDGPWKFSNLPGLILEVKINFGPNLHMIYSCTSIQKIDEFPKLNDFTSPKETLKKIKKDFYTKMKKNFKYLRTISNGDIKMRMDDLDFEPIVFDTNNK